MRIFKTILISLAAVSFSAAQVQSGAFQHLPAMPFQGPRNPVVVKRPAAKPLVIAARPAQMQPCAIPLLNATPSGNTHYTVQTVTPPKGRLGAMVYAQTAPTCGEAGK